MIQKEENMDSIERLLKELTEVSGVSGYEQEIRDTIRRYFIPLGELTQDKLGTLICKQTGETEAPKVVLAAHMDEIGFMVKFITTDGFIDSLLLEVGGIKSCWPSASSSKPVKAK